MNCSNVVEAMNRKFELSSLSDFISHALIFTEAVKDTLQFECAEARFSLKPWITKTFVTKEVNKNDCICDKMSFGSQEEDISEGISRTILQAQKLREKLSSNVSKQEKHSKQKDLDKTNVQKVCYEPTKHDIVKSHVEMDIKSFDKNPKKIQNVTKITSKIGISEQGSIKASQIPSTSRTNIKQKGKKNFLLANKLNIKNIQSAKTQDNNKSKEIKNNTKFINSKKQPEVRAASTSELTKLIEELSLASSKKMSTISTNINRKDCPLHGENVTQFTEEILSMDIVDALDKFDIPKEILKVLRVYHLYVKFEHTQESVNNLQHRTAAAGFLKEFEKMNENKKNYSEEENNIVSIALESFSVLGNVYNGMIHIDKIKELDKRLESIYKMHKIKKFDIRPNENVKPLETRFKYSEIAGWMSNGIWNNMCIKDFQGMSKVCCIRYNDVAQLSSLYEVLQEFQHTKYVNTIIEILLKDIIPKMMHCFEPTDDIYLQIYKMIDILSQGLNPENPVLVRTEE
ncbi:uncharacterized protein LOC118444300 isoform X1 [Vespa mandarinia]|uniref:uncharacterized protein LOC118444300 isoform X1 n=2 Tax=Vespa mandarinia TaxID=7446 RepID=UPI001608873C|nr:uncharacterized protein LOC118444300 isoform X1 [Vespa mandarinia]